MGFCLPSLKRAWDLVYPGQNWKLETFHGKSKPLISVYLGNSSKIYPPKYKTSHDYLKNIISN